MAGCWLADVPAWFDPKLLATKLLKLKAGWAGLDPLGAGGLVFVAGLAVFLIAPRLSSAPLFRFEFRVSSPPATQASAVRRS